MLVAATTPLLAAGCDRATGDVAAPPGGDSSGAGASGGVIEVAAAENFWGSIASQVGGIHVHVTSIITNPNADPHSYEPTPADGRTVASARLVIVNGVGYDPWASKLLGADAGGRAVLDVGDLLGLKEGDNPHRWYDPSDVRAFVSAYVTALSRDDPPAAGYFRSRQVWFDSVALRPFDELVAQIKAGYSGTPVGASESIFSLLAPALGLRVLTPYSFLQAISEGTDVSAADKTTIDDQIRTHQIRIYVYNSQNTTPDVQVQLKECQTAHIPTATITETLTPAAATYQQWQTDQLRGILTALNRASGRR
jgi:zinc/manganese transport system substrate-binding protein